MFSRELRRHGVLLAITDSIALLVALWIAAALHHPWQADAAGGGGAEEPQLYATVVFTIGGWIVVSNLLRLSRLRNVGLNELIAIARACVATTFLVLVVEFVAHLVPPPRLTVALAFGLSIVLIAVGRALACRCVEAFYSRSGLLVPLVVVGFNPMGQYLCDQTDELRSYELLGFLDDEIKTGAYGGRAVLGGTTEIARLAASNPGLEVAIVLPDADSDYIRQLVRLCEHHHVRWSVMPSMFRSLSAGLRVDMAGVIPLVGPRNSKIEGLNFVIKRAFDVSVASVILLLASPVMLLAALALWLIEGRPLLFRQTRIGLHGEPFEVLKFRTMRPLSSDAVHREYVRKWIQDKRAAATDGNGKSLFKLSSDDRVTRLGRLLRRFSIDELPQLFNVLRGEMSLIGPRPALPYEIDLYQDWHHRRLEAPPGITGLWQVSGRNHLSFEDMVRLDIKYIEDWSLGRDLAILLRTVPAVLHGGGV